MEGRDKTFQVSMRLSIDISFKRADCAQRPCVGLDAMALELRSRPQACCAWNKGNLGKNRIIGRGD